MVQHAHHAIPYVSTSKATGSQVCAGPDSSATERVFKEFQRFFLKNLK